MRLFKNLAPLALAAAAMGSAHADVSLLDSSMYGAISGSKSATVGAVTFTSKPRAFITKSFNGASGLGVSGGRTSDEIDGGETVTMSWADALVITNFSISMLYNGPEFGDWAEAAKVTAYNGKTVVAVGKLKVDPLADTVATFGGTGFGSVANLSPADGAHGGVWSVSDPFGGAEVTRLSFKAIKSKWCGQGSCDNQSDFVLSSVAAVPEPETYALLLAGLGAVAFVARRRRAVA